MKNLFIIGNGFDLNLGYKTGYPDLIASEQFEALIANDNKLCIHLKEQENLCNWVDIETELIAYSILFNPKNKDRKPFRMEYYALRDALCDYITSLDLSTYNKNAYLHNIIKGMPNSWETTILDFNYTDSVRRIFQSHTVINNREIINVHGLANNKDIIFGIQESANKDDDDIWLLKIVDRNYKNIEIKDYLVDAEAIYFLGFSLGESDHSYFKDFFQHYHIHHKDKPVKKIYFPFYKEEGRIDLHKQIFSLTGGSLSQFKKNFDVRFIDIIEEETKNENKHNRQPKKSSRFTL